jgi:hypothetical protein
VPQQKDGEARERTAISEVVLMQQTLFGTEVVKEPVKLDENGQKEAAKMHEACHREQTSFNGGEAKTRKQIDDETYTTEHCLDRIEKEEYLWDMRCWDSYHNREEVLAWVVERDNMMNCGHIRFLINILLDRGIDKEVIADAVMRNNNIKYKNRLAKCFRNGTDCPEYVKNNNRFGSECNCKGCE